MGHSSVLLWKTSWLGLKETVKKKKTRGKGYFKKKLFFKMCSFKLCFTGGDDFHQEIELFLNRGTI